MKAERLFSRLSIILRKKAFATAESAGGCKRPGSSVIPRSSGQRDYSKIRWKKEELLTALGKSFGVCVLLAYFFYRSVLAVIPMIPIGAWFLVRLKRQIIRRDTELLEEQFCECIQSVGTAVRAGASVENAFAGSYPVMASLYGEDAMICEELRFFRRGLARNIPPEELLRNLSQRAPSEAIGQFAAVFSIVKKNGGKMDEIIRGSVDLIRAQQESRKEIRTLLSGRQMEMNIMRGMPFLIVFYVGIGRPGFFDALYAGLGGRLLMTAMLAVYLAAYLLGDRTLGRLGKEV